MTAFSDEPTQAADDTSQAPPPTGKVLPRRTRRTSAIADASVTTSRTPTDWAGGDTSLPRPRQAAPAVPAAPEQGEAAAEPDSAYADGFAAGLAFASPPASDEASGPVAAAVTAPQAPAAPGPAAPRPRRGRPRPLLLICAGLAVGVLVCVPFLLRGSGADHAPTTVTLVDDNPADTAPVVGPVTASPSGGSSPTATGTAPRSPQTGSPHGPTATASTPEDTATPTPTASATAKDGKTPRHQAGAPSQSAVASGTAIRSHDSGRCIDGSTPWGSPLQIWDCTGSAAQSWQINPDGSVRALGRCMDVAGGSRDDGAVVQLVDCNGTGAQQFRLNAAHDLVNLQADKCVEAEDSPGGNGTSLRLWSCSGADNQKWSRG